MSGLLSTFMNWATWPAVLGFPVNYCKLLDLFDSHFGKRFFGVPVQNLSRLARFTKGSSWVLCWLCWNRYSRRCHSTKKGTLVFFSMGLSAHIRQTPKRGWLVSPKRQDGKTLFLKKILRPEGYVHRSNSLDPISQPAAQLVVILPHIFALGVLWVLILFLAEPMSFQKMGWKNTWSQPFYARILMVLPIATGKLKHAFQIGGTWIDRGFMLNPPNLWRHIWRIRAIHSHPRSSHHWPGAPDRFGHSWTICVNTTALCHPHPRTRWPILANYIHNINIRVQLYSNYNWPSIQIIWMIYVGWYMMDNYIWPIMAKWSDQNIPSGDLRKCLFQGMSQRPKEAPKGPKHLHASPHHHGRNTT